MAGISGLPGTKGISGPLGYRGSAGSYGSDVSIKGFVCHQLLCNLIIDTVVVAVEHILCIM